MNRLIWLMLVYLVAAKRIIDLLRLDHKQGEGDIFDETGFLSHNVLLCPFNLGKHHKNRQKVSELEALQILQAGNDVGFM
jgi:hypothetical protein